MFYGTPYSIGLFYEKKACEYLKKNNYEILHNRYKTKYGEIDIIAFGPNINQTQFEQNSMQQIDQDEFLLTHNQNKNCIQTNSIVACLNVDGNEHRVSSYDNKHRANLYVNEMHANVPLMQASSILKKDLYFFEIKKRKSINSAICSISCKQIQRIQDSIEFFMAGNRIYENVNIHFSIMLFDSNDHLEILHDVLA